MQEYAKDFGLIKNGWKFIVASSLGEKIRLTTDHIKRSLDHGSIVTQSLNFSATKKAQLLRVFLNFVKEKRRRGVVDKSINFIAETSMLFVDSADSIQLMYKSKLENTLFGNETKVDQKIC